MRLKADLQLRAHRPKAYRLARCNLIELTTFK